MPAFAPVESPLFEFALCVGGRVAEFVADVVERVVLTRVEIGVDESVAEEAADDAVVEADPTKT